MTRSFVIGIDGHYNDVVTITVDSISSIVDKMQDLVLKFVRTELCDIKEYKMLNKHTFEITGTKGTVYKVDWQKVTIYTEDEVKELYS